MPPPMKPLLIGEAPSKNEVTEQPLEGRVGKRLAKLCGLTLPEYLNHFERVNLLHVRQDSKEKGFEFDMVAAIHATTDICKLLTDPDRIILMLGARVAYAFGVKNMYFAQQKIPWIYGKVHVLPHPSGINRWFNHPLNYRQMEEFMRSIVERTR
jgi:uracil-DNA glycosylase